MDDEKIDHILDAAFEVFVRYGFRRTTMSDLADAAGVSRPLLYTRFKDKEDLFRAVAGRQIGRALERGLEKLAADGHLCDRLLAAFMRWSGDFVQMFESTPHAKEILDANQDLAGDIARDAAGTFRQALIDAIASEHDAGTLDLNRNAIAAEDIAAVLTDVSNGVKYRLGDIGQYELRLTTALRFIDAATRKPRTRPWGSK